MIKRDQYLSFRLSEEENQRIREQAISLNLTISEFMRRRLFDKQTMPVSESDIRRVTELKQLERQLYQATKTINWNIAIGQDKMPWKCFT